MPACVFDVCEQNTDNRQTSSDLAGDGCRQRGGDEGMGVDGDGLPGAALWAEGGGASKGSAADYTGGLGNGPSHPQRPVMA
jgi:hypothetical protein